LPNLDAEFKRLATKYGAAPQATDIDADFDRLQAKFAPQPVNRQVTVDGSAQSPVTPQEPNRNAMVNTALRSPRGNLGWAVSGLANIASPLVEYLGDVTRNIPQAKDPTGLSLSQRKSSDVSADVLADQFAHMDWLAKTGSTLQRGALGAVGGGLGMFTQGADLLVNPQKYGTTQIGAIDQTAAGLTDMVANVPDQIAHISDQMTGGRTPVSDGIRALGSVANVGRSVAGVSREDAEKQAVSSLYTNPESLAFGLGIGKGLVGKAGKLMPKTKGVATQARLGEGSMLPDVSMRDRAPGFQRDVSNREAFMSDRRAPVKLGGKAEVPTEALPEKVAAKEPWEMTQKEWLTEQRRITPVRELRKSHGEKLEDAAIRSETIPSEYETWGMTDIEVTKWSENIRRAAMQRLAKAENDLARTGKTEYDGGLFGIDNSYRGQAVIDNLRNELEIMTRNAERMVREHKEITRRFYDKSRDMWIYPNVIAKHKSVVERALKSNKPVPPEVLADYPELAPTRPAPRLGSYKPTNIKRKPTKPAKSTTLGFMGANPDVLRSIGTDAVKAGRAISTATAEIAKSVKVDPKIAKNVDRVTATLVEHDRNIRRAESTHKLLEKLVKDHVKDPERQMLMTHAYEHKMRGPYWNKLTEIEKGVVRFMAQEKTKLNRYIKENDILEMSETPGINHIYHHWINPESGKPFDAMYGKFSKGLPQAKQRTITDYASGIKAGLKPASPNIGALIGLEWEAATRANINRQVFTTIHSIDSGTGAGIKMTMNGKSRPSRMVERWDLLQKQGLTEGYTRYSHYALDKELRWRDGQGNTVRMKGAVGVRDEIYPMLKAYLESPEYGKLDNLLFATKSLKLGVSLFHVMSLGMQELANWRIPFKNIPRGLRLRRELGPEMRLLHQEGLELFKGYEDTGYRNTFFEGTNVGGKVGNAVTVPISLMRDFIFDCVQPGMKTSFAFDKFNKLLPRYLKKYNPEVSLEAARIQIESGAVKTPAILKCAREVVNKSDGHFSGEHYKRALLESTRFMQKMYFMPEARKWWQRGLLSPTWQREHLLIAKNVAKSFMPDKMIKKLGMSELGPIKRDYRKYALGGIAMVGAVDMWNYLATEQMDGKGKHIWENPTGKGFAVRAWWDEPDYTVTDKNGKTRTIRGGPAYIRPLKSVFEVAEWVHDPITKMTYKLSPMASGIGEQIFPSGYKQYHGWESIDDRARDFILEVGTPITADQIAKWSQGKKSATGAILPFFGFPTSKVKREKEKTTQTKSRGRSTRTKRTRGRR